MSVQTENTQPNQSALVVKSADTIEVPYEIALDNFKILSDLLAYQWIYTDLSTKKITPWCGIWSYLYNPVPSMALVKASAATLLNTIKSDKKEDIARRALLLDLHQRMGEGLERVSKTFERPYPKIAQELKDLSKEWNDSKPTEEQVRIAKIYLIRRPVPGISRAEAIAVLKQSQAFLQKQAETATITYKEYPKSVPKEEVSPQQEWEKRKTSGVTTPVNTSPLAKKKAALTDPQGTVATAIVSASKFQEQRKLTREWVVSPGNYAKKTDVAEVSPQDAWRRRTESHVPKSIAKERPVLEATRKTSYQDQPSFKDILMARRGKIEGDKKE